MSTVKYRVGSKVATKLSEKERQALQDLRNNGWHVKMERRPEVPRKEIITVDGISYNKFHWDGGTTLESPCTCYGAKFRCHSTEYCPWKAKRNEHS